MDLIDKKKIEKQLTDQAEMIVNEKNDIELIISTIVSCQALLRIAENCMPDLISNDDLNDICAAYCGIASKVVAFYENNHESLIDTNSKLIKDILDDINKKKEEKNALDIDLVRVSSELSVANDALDKKKEEHEKASSNLGKAKKEYEEVEDSRRRFVEEKESYEKKIESFNKELDELTTIVATLERTYDELTGEYQEYYRIKKALEEEGFVDINSFNKAAASKEADGQEIIKWTDNILAKISMDVENLRNEIENKRKGK